MGVSLDLRKAHKHARHGDITVILTWVNDERSLVLAPSHRRDAGWYIVQESAAYLWGVDHPDPMIRRPAQEHALVQSHIACSMLGIEPNKANRAKIISIVTGWLPDLVEMPSAPEETFGRKTYGQMILNADGAPIGGEDIRLKDEGVQYGG